MAPAAAFYATSNTINREKLQASNPFAAVPKIPLLAIKGALCFRCFQAPAGPLTSCAGCHRASYCSDLCRRWDWDAQHGKQCKLLQRVNELQSSTSGKKRTWEQYSVDLFEQCQQIKDLADSETVAQVTRLVGYQPYCTGCHRSTAQIPLGNLRACHRCRLAFACGSCAASHSNKDCDQNKQIADLELSRLRNFEDNGSARSTMASPLPSQNGTPLSQTTGWHDYFSSTSNSPSKHARLLPVPSLEAMSDKALTPQEVRAQERRDRQFSLATESMSIPMTILAALEDTIPDLRTRETLSIHLVGASSREVGDIVLFEELLHLIPSLKYIEVVLAGPEAPGGEGEGLAGSQLVEMDCCSDCTSQGRRRTCRLFRGVYDEFAKTKVYSKPGLAVLFHSGRSQEAVESWKPTTKFLVDEEILTLCTTYTEREAIEETKELDEWGVKFLIRPEINRWKAMVPIPELMEGEEGAVYYVNYYRYIFRGRLSPS